MAGFSWRLPKRLPPAPDPLIETPAPDPLIEALKANTDAVDDLRRNIEALIQDLHSIQTYGLRLEK